MEGGKDISRQGMTFDSPSYLPDGQNLFEQAPLAQIVQQIHEASANPEQNVPAMPIEKVRALLSTIAAKRNRSTKAEDAVLTPAERLERLIDEKRLDPARFLAEYHSNSFTRRYNWGKAVLATLGSVGSDIRPALVDYIGANMLQFMPNGEVIQGTQQPKVRLPVPSFGEWYLQRQDRQQRIRDAAIRVVVDEAFSSTPQSVVEESGKTVVNKRYRFIHEHPGMNPFGKK